VKCYSLYDYHELILNAKDKDILPDCWEVDYDLKNTSVVGLYRFTRFKTFEEA